jgi:hypothetical protein
MRYRVAVEDIEPNHYVCWILDLPGCFSSAPHQHAAVTRAPAEIVDYFAWITDHDSSLPHVSGPFVVNLVETFEAHPCSDDPDYSVNAFFEDDRRPLSYWEVAGRHIWSRRSLWRDRSRDRG